MNVRGKGFEGGSVNGGRGRAMWSEGEIVVNRACVFRKQLFPEINTAEISCHKSTWTK